MMRKAVKEGRYWDAAKEAGTTAGEYYQATVNKVVEIEKSPTVQAIERQTVQAASYVWQGACYAGMTLWANVPPKEKVMQASRDFFDDFCGHGKEEKKTEEESCSTNTNAGFRL